MKKFVIGAVAALVAAISISTAAEAAPRWQKRGFHENGFRHNGWNNRGWNNRGWRSGWNHGWRNNGWYGGYRHGYWGGPRIVIGGPVYDDYCFIRKVRHHDRYGNVFIKRVRVCR